MAKAASRMAKAMIASMKRKPLRGISPRTKVIYMASPGAGVEGIYVGSGWRYPNIPGVMEKYWLVEFRTGTVRVDPQDCLIWE